MNTKIALAALASVALLASSALPCGGGFGEDLELSPSQSIVISHKNGVESYFFSPHFCGSKETFGLILPLPASLSDSPKLGDSKLVAQLEDLTKPEVIEVTECRNNERGFDGSGEGGAGTGGSWSGHSGVDVVDKGQVGVFDWTLLKADTAASFTDWLDANKYPFDPTSLDQFTYYVDSGWYFIAFKVTADSAAPPEGSLICGDLGPIQLSFPSASPIIPARIAAAASQDGSYDDFVWRVFALASTQLEVKTEGAYSTLRYSGAISAKHLSSYSALSTMAGAGDRLTAVDVDFYPADLTSDLSFGPAPFPADYRLTEVNTTYIDCGGCSFSLPPAGWSFGALSLGLVALAARRLRKRR